MPDLYRRVVGDGLWVLGARACHIASFYGTTVLLARQIAHDQMGLYFLISAYAGLLSIVAQFGLTTIAVKNVSGAIALGDVPLADREAKSMIAHGGLGFLLIVGVGGIYIFSTHLINGQVTLLVPEAIVFYVALLGALQGFQAILAELLRGYGRIVAASLLSGAIAWALVFFGISIASLLGAHFSVWMAIGIWVFCTALSVIFGIGMLRHSWLNMGGIRSYRSKECLSFSGIQLTTFLFFQADMLVAGAVLPFSEMAIYGVANRLVQFLAFPIEALEVSMLPHLASQGAQGKKRETETLARRAAKIQTGVTLSMIALFLVFQRTVFSVFFGPEYSAAVGLFVILSVGWVVRAAAGAFGQVMIMYGQGMVMMRFAFWWSVISIPLEYGLWRIAGAQGIAIGAAVLLGIYCIMASRMTRRKLNINVNIFMTQSY